MQELCPVLQDVELGLELREEQDSSLLRGRDSPIRCKLKTKLVSPYVNLSVSLLQL